MKISHESPLCLLEDSLSYNDYQYCLPRFYTRYEQYKEFFLRYRKQKDSFIVLDNGLFEGDAFSDNQLLKLIEEIKPDIFVAPDAWNDSKTTFENAERWIKKIQPKTELMVVLQGNSYYEIQKLYERCNIDLGYRYFAFNHSSRTYGFEYPHSFSNVSAMIGRIGVINKLLYDGTLAINKYHHLLGCSLPEEFQYYNSKTYDFIKSVDTSNPVINGIKGIRYDGEMIFEKHREKMEVFMEKDLASNLGDIKFNIEKFRTWVER